MADNCEILYLYEEQIAALSRAYRKKLTRNALKGAEVRLAFGDKGVLKTIHVTDTKGHEVHIAIHQ